MITKVVDRIGPRPIKLHELQQSGTLYVIETERQFAAELASFDCIVYLTGYGSKMQYKDVESAIADAEAVLFHVSGNSIHPASCILDFG